MNTFYLVSATLAFFAAAAHSYLGERYVLAPLFAARPQPVVLAAAPIRRVIRAVWHLPSMTWAVLAALVLRASAATLDPAMAATTALILFLSGLGNLLALRRVHVGWLVLFSSAVCLVLGTTWR